MKKIFTTLRSGKLFLYFLLGGTLSTAVLSCKKNQNIDDQNLAGIASTVTNNMLNITSGDFNAIKQEYLTNKKKYSNRYGSIKSFASAIGDLSATENQNPTFQTALNEIMSDELMSSVLNDKGQIIVDNQLYRVTVFGTFKTTPDNQANLDKLINNLYVKNDLGNLDLDNPVYNLSEFYKGGNASIEPSAPIEMVDNITYIPTFESDEVSVQEPVQEQLLLNVDPETIAPANPTTRPSRTSGGSTGGGRPSRGGDTGNGGSTGGGRPSRGGDTGGGTPTTPRPSRNVDGTTRPSRGSTTPTISNALAGLPEVETAFENPMFSTDNMATGNMVNPEGKFFTTLLKNSTLYNKFDNEYRTSVLFYNRNYGFSKSIGIKVKHQKRGTLWWNKSKTNVIAAGWETILYTKPESDPLKRYYGEYIPKSTIYGNPSGSFNDELIPQDLEILKVTNGFGESYFPLIFADQLPIPNDVAKGGFNNIIKYLWGIILKRMKSGEAIIKEANSGRVVKFGIDELKSKPKGLMLKSPEGNGEPVFVFPPYMQLAYDTDMIDIPLDNYTSDFLVPANILFANLLNPKASISKLTDWGRTEIKKSFKVKQAIVYGASQKSGLWRGVRVIHN